MNPSLDMNDTLVFVRVVQAGGFTAAAQLLGMPKTTVSRKVQELEKRLGTRLLHRSTRRIALTEAGSLYYEHGLRAAEALAEGQAEIEQVLGGPRGWLRVAAPHSFGVRWIAPLLGPFSERYPEVRVELLLGHERLDLLDRRLDIALRLGPLADSSLVARRLATFAMHLYASEAYLQRYGEPRDPHELREHRTLALPLARRHDGYAWALCRDGQWQDYPIAPTLVASDPEALYDPLLTGQGILLTMGINLRSFVEQGRVRRVLPDWDGPRPAFNAVFPQGHGRSPKVRAFVDFLVERLHFAADDATPGAPPEAHA
ncbi:LysR family transcriptional regulator [Pseudomonas mangiferae]|uniref:LysR family transcriptional regulator n=1 Tax=Pseudomonas mangiferae TaxID=2593654 RepID=A0A553GUG4_9PSED|nr:LysR family transcriptional regulator [Pseudomonas mangiferae]TRX73109.1 LysR family transcriptional regulator [Pseudomonas mangiferae]